jgi:hypothetical protein
MVLDGEPGEQFLPDGGEQLGGVGGHPARLVETGGRFA